ncbi:MAG TPA: ATP synthase F1 subunit epsilon, partial [Xanthobacteraceae bacterium]|nr:ATP synthase F1 subunit epsilon [Xanthobacteraceae bacterium]
VPGSEGDFGILPGHAATVSLLRPGILTIYANGAQTKMVVLGGFAEVSAEGTLTILAEVADTVEDFDQAALTARITAMEERVKSMEAGSLLDKEIQRLDHYKQVNHHLQGTAMH